VLRYGRSDELAHRLPAWTALFAQVHATPEGTEHLVVVIRYLLWIGGKTIQTAAGQVLHSVMGAQQAEALMGSWAEEMIERGLQQGLARGREEGLCRGRAESLLRLLTLRRIPVDEASRQRILDCTELETLDRWFDRALQVTTVSELLDDGARASPLKDS
jgi:predicted transposase YdaD